MSADGPQRDKENAAYLTTLQDRFHRQRVYIAFGHPSTPAPVPVT